jgi:outer membrane biogenesis lipoprotein LolB
MKSHLPVLVLTGLLLTSCTSPAPKNQSEYDQLKLIQWQTCLNHFIEDARDFYSTSEITTFRATEACMTFLPEKK